MTGLRWGIMGTGGIAAAMTGALQESGSQVVAVGSARPGAAREFATEWDIAQAVGSHRAVADAPDVEVVYVATTNDRHRQNVLDCVDLGKPVLCEKPLALNVRQAEEMLSAAQRAGVFAMEAMWMRFLPFLETIDQLVGAGTIGELRHVQAWFSYPASQDPSRRWMNRHQGGGSLLDLGIYPVSLVHHLLGPPESFDAAADLSATGVDLSTNVMSRHAGGTSAAIASSFAYELTNEAVLSGTEARIRVHAPFYHSPLVTVERGGDVIATHDTSYDGHGFRFEIAEAERCIAASLTESPLRPHAHTLEVMSWMDAIRDRCGIEYPGDAP